MRGAATRAAVTAWFLVGCVVVEAGRTGPEQSSAAAAELVTLMKSRGLDAVAALDPERSGRIVAALLIPDVQLLVTGATSTASAYLETQIVQRQYRDVYATLNSTAVLDTKLFFQDMGCDGLTDGDSGVDVMYEKGTTQTLFDGNWKRQKMSKAAYEGKTQKADADYSRMLTILTQSLQREPAGGGR